MKGKIALKTRSIVFRRLSPNSLKQAVLVGLLISDMYRRTWNGILSGLSGQYIQLAGLFLFLDPSHESRDGRSRKKIKGGENICQSFLLLGVQVY